MSSVAGREALGAATLGILTTRALNHAKRITEESLPEGYDPE